MSKFKNTVTFLLLMISAYAFSVAIDLFLGKIFGVYSISISLSVLTWSITSLVIYLIATKVITLRRWFYIPFAIIGSIALFGGLVGTHPHNYGVAAIMLISAKIISLRYSHTL